MKKYFVVILIIYNLCLLVCYAHPGRTDKYGGHTDKSTGEYHYHNADGSVTVAPKPTQSQVPAENNDTTKVEEEPNIPSAIVVNEIEKPLQKSATDNIKQQTPKPVTDTEEIVETIDENGNTIIYISKTSPYENINEILLSLLIILAVTGLCSISPIVCILLKRVEDKSPSWSALLHIPYLIFWPPSLIGNMLYKLYNKVKPKDNNDYYEDYEDYEI